MRFGETAAEFDRRTGTIHLQGVGRHPAKSAGELRVGDRTVWNTGSVYRVESVKLNPSGKTLETALRDEASGKLYPRRFAVGRLVAVLPLRS
jgi:hypothetical protein